MTKPTSAARYFSKGDRDSSMFCDPQVTSTQFHCSKGHRYSTLLMSRWLSVDSTWNRDRWLSSLERVQDLYRCPYSELFFRKDTFILTNLISRGRKRLQKTSKDLGWAILLPQFTEMCSEKASFWRGRSERSRSMPYFSIYLGLRWLWSMPTRSSNPKAASVTFLPVSNKFKKHALKWLNWASMTSALSKPCQEMWISARFHTIAFSKKKTSLRNRSTLGSKCLKKVESVKTKRLRKTSGKRSKP